MSDLTTAGLDRAAGVLVGLAAGDSLGAGYEFQASPPTDPSMIGGGPFGWEPGEWTDDTQMALCIAEVAATGQFESTDVALGFLAWFGSGPADVGVQTRAVLSRARDAADLSQQATRHFRQNPHNSAGNGSLMRTAPIALAHLGDDDAIARTAMAVSALTHGDPLAGEACVLWCIGIDRAVREARLDGVRDGIGLLPATNRERWVRWLDEAEELPPRSFAANGFVVTALQAAYAALSQTPVPVERPCTHLSAALAAAVAIGHDTDTVAAIAGGLLGARWGASAVPLAWRSLLHGWPGYRTEDLVRLAVLTARAGGTDRQGWPSIAKMADYYATHHACAPAAAALADDDGVVIGNVPGLGHLLSRSDIVVSLCRMGTADVAAGVERHELWLTDTVDPSDNPNLDFVLVDAARAIAAWRDAGRTVFIHCVRAESRTPTVAAAYLAERFGLGGLEALARVRSVLPGAHPNRAFLAALDRLWPAR